MKRLLFVTIHFPPMNSPSSRRALDLVRTFTEMGWGVDVVTFTHPFNYYDRSIDEPIPLGCRVRLLPVNPLFRIAFGTTGTEPGEFKSKRTAARGLASNVVARRAGRFVYNKIVVPNLLIPDDFVTVLPSFARDLIKNRGTHYDLVLSLGPPLSVHVMALFAKEAHGVPWIGYWDDPVTFGPFSENNSRLKNRTSRLIEGVCVRKCARVIVTTQETKEGFESLHGKAAGQKTVVLPCYFSKAEHARATPTASTKFRILYTGTLAWKGRSLEAITEALRLMQSDEVELLVAGRCEPAEEFTRYIEEAGLAKTVVYAGSGFARDTIASLQKGAAILLVVGWSGGFQIPMKLYEYIGARRPILVVKYGENDAASKIVTRLQRGLCVANDVGAIRHAIERLFALWKSGGLDDTFDLSENTEFERENVLDSLRLIIEETDP